MNVVDELVSNGTLVYNKEDVPIKATYASRYSMYVNFLNGNGVIDENLIDKTKNRPPSQPERRFNFISDTIFEGLTMNLDGSEFHFGKCRFISDSDNPQYSGKLFFTEEVYDIFEIFSAHKLIALEDHFRNLALILPQKEKIIPEFREYTSNLTYDLKVYKSMFDDIDAKFISEEPIISNVIQSIILEKEGRVFFDYFDKKLEELKELVSSFSEQEHATHGYYFRKQLWDVILCSEFMTRTNLKPRGYPGDSRMMQMLYENTYRGNSTFAKLMHKHPLEAPAAQAVRNRINILGDVISKMGNDFNNAKENFEILSLACGPAKELENIVTSKEQCSKYHFTLFDQDIKAIEEAETTIKNIENRLNEKLKHTVIKDSIRTIISVPDLSEKWGSFHFIYALGLFDYLTDRVAQAVIPKLFKLLKPGGQLVIGNYHIKNENKYYMEYWLDWTLYYRNEEEMMNLVKSISPVETELFFDDSQSQMFLKITKL